MKYPGVNGLADCPRCKGQNCQFTRASADSHVIIHAHKERQLGDVYHHDVEAVFCTTCGYPLIQHSIAEVRHGR